MGTEFMLNLLLVVGPLFLVAACFPATRPHFDNWTKKIIEMIFIKMFALAVITLGLSVISAFLGKNNIEGVVNNQATRSVYRCNCWCFMGCLPMY
ncbi:inner membrane protein of type IV secretion of T-DNA complex VirB6 [Vibrio astriarenae]|nr:inner membrane protein of type IV secretion of T-DNA complex VirB6 [Vibrio sp. C7]